MLARRWILVLPLGAMSGIEIYGLTDARHVVVADFIGLVHDQVRHL